MPATQAASRLKHNLGHRTPTSQRGMRTRSGGSRRHGGARADDEDCVPSATLAGRAFFRNGGQPGATRAGFGPLISAKRNRDTQHPVCYGAKALYADSGGADLRYTYRRQANATSTALPFDGPPSMITFITSNAAAKHRFVAAGSLDGPWGITFGAKLTLATPTPINAVACYGAQNPNGAPCNFVAAEPPGNGKFVIGGDIWGFRDFDLQATKEFEFGDGYSVFARIDVLNVFHGKNLSSYTYNFGGAACSTTTSSA